MESLGNSNYWALEDRLNQVLKPVAPDPMFVDTLKFKLSRTPAVILESGKKHIGLMVVGIGLFTGALAYWIYRKLRD